ncbi:MAG: transcription-repair coupling factor [Desulfobulbaceae bacterium]|nr:transcription-repair coupling factor [Desulfobulbaceae bacterium]HIJ79416.1 transcription-repair coupling factor [Deltaproteobacteria bacterium]
METLLTTLAEKSESVNLTGVRGSSNAMLIAQTTKLNRPIVCVTPSETSAQHLACDLGFFSNQEILSYPAYEIPPYTPLSPDNQTIADRLATLYQLINAGKPYILIVSIEALLRRVFPKEYIANQAELVMAGEEIDQEALSRSLIALGYETSSLVRAVGEFSIRGGIFDIFPPGFEMPLRLDFFGEMIESIREFDPISQRSVAEREEAILLPVNDVLFPQSKAGNDELQLRFRTTAESLHWDADKAGRLAERIRNGQRFPGIEFLLPLFYQKTDTLLEYLPGNPIFFLENPNELSKSIKLCWERIEQNHQESLAADVPALPPEQLFVTEPQLQAALANFQQGRFYDFAHSEMLPGQTLPINCGNHSLLKQNIELNRRKLGLLPELTRQLLDWLKENHRIILACRTKRHAEHLAELLRQHDLPVTLAEAPYRESEVDSGRITLYDAPLTSGFDLIDHQLHFVSESELFGELRLGPKKTKHKAVRPTISFEELNVGDVVVHRAHGLGIYEGIINIELNSVANDFLQITYRDQDKLYVPVHQLSVVNKYKGISDKEPKLDKLGGKAWQTNTKKVREEVWKVANDLLQLYAKRAMAVGHAFSQPDEMFHELEESFPYDETPGQLKAINDVLDDLTAAQPMDRLVCGDVGYGKTEVAIRAAFKVVIDSFQVAILVPTTVLAEQHAETFRERLHGFPVRIESLTRFRTPAEQREIVKDVLDGKVDIIIGTHRLLSKDVVFRRLGLLIVDEEHRFGVAHKEKLKKLKNQVDVLTLTATPIPRTMQLSLLGIRDLSVISSPPQHRRPVKTFVARHDELVIKEAVVREMQRGGQVFIVHNRVHSIHEVAATVQKLVPEARIAVAHGQMAGKALEEIMVRFVHREVDVLICTTIIESGLDIPNANTIVITRADRLGLAEIYQLRGRVGRGKVQAYAYLLVPSMDGLSKDAQQRLRALIDFNELGGGFKLAMSDLQIRGGGNILGISQSGTIAAVGYDLYLDLLQQTVQDLKRQNLEGEAVGELEVDPEIKLNISAYIPEKYIQSTNQRYIAYRRITSVTKDDELLDMEDEFQDRYGPIPQETTNLLDVMKLKNLLRRLKITKLEQGPTNLVFSFHETTPVKTEKLLAFINKHKKMVRLTPDARLIIKTEATNTVAQIFQQTKNVVDFLMGDDIF